MDESQLAKVIREKEDLQLLLNKFERHMGEVCNRNLIDYFYSLFY
jgi:hypothetical protein